MIMRGRVDRPFTISRKSLSSSQRSNASFPISNRPTSNAFIDQKLIEGSQTQSVLTMPHQDETETYLPDVHLLPPRDNDDLRLDAFDLELLAQSNRCVGSLQTSSYIECQSTCEPPQKEPRKEVSRFFCSDSQITPHRALASSSSEVDMRSSSSPLARLQRSRAAILFQKQDLEYQGFRQGLGAHPGAPESRHGSSEPSPVGRHTQSTPFQSIPVSIRGIVLLSVQELPDNYRTLFNFPVFNAVQSKSFQPIYKSDDNVVLAAPTGSGKTVVMELAICRLLNSLKDERFKVIYQAPTKSLCSERFRDWNRKFYSLGLQCAELTGDTDYTQLKNVQNSQIIITTPEKWDSMTRKWKDHARLMQLVKLFLIDEVHTLKETRGATLEAVVSRMKSIGSNVRFVALSATIPNSEDIAAWLGRNSTNQITPAHREHFGEEFRPVKLQRYVYGYQSHSNDFAFDKMCNSKLPDIIATHSCRKPIMIFCCTRNSTVATAKELTRLWSMSNPPARLWKGPSKPIEVHNVDLKATITAGIGFHHAGLDQSDRYKVENGFLQGQISIICCTSTLAVGVNLPCHLVIIKNTVGWQDGCCQEYSDLEIMQMLGRAGRPQFDDTAAAVIMTKKERVGRYEKLVSGSESLESCLHLNLIDHLNAEIGLGNVTSVESAVHWLAGTFLFVRLRRNPTHYRLKEGASSEDEDEMLRQICEKDIKLLREYGLVASEGLKSTPFGDAMARYYIQFETMKAFLSLESHSTVSQILSIIAKAEEFRDLRLKAGEKSLYKEINRASDISFPVAVDIALPAHKVSLLIQSELGAVEFPAGEQFQKHKFAFQQDKNFIFSHVNRLIRCVIDCQIFLQDSITVRNALELSRSLGSKVWDSSPLQMKQIEQVGVVAVRKLVAAGIDSIEALENTEAHRIDMILSKNPPFGLKILGRLSDFPRLRVSLKMIGKDIKLKTLGKVRFKAEIGFMNEKCPTFFQRRPVHICFLAETSDGHLIDFRRISANKIQNNHEIMLNSELKQPGQHIICYVMGDNIAGTLRWATLKPNLVFSPQQRYTVQARATRKNTDEAFQPTTSANNNVSLFDSDDVLFGDFLEAEQSPAGPIDSNPKKSHLPKHKTPIISAEMKKNTDPIRSKPNEVRKESSQLNNGRWACNHKCKDKLTCKHICCREGLKKPPKSSQRRCDECTQEVNTSNQLTLSPSIAKAGTHINSATKVPNQRIKDNGYGKLGLTGERDQDLPVSPSREVVDNNPNSTSPSKCFSSDYGDDTFDDFPSPSTFLFGNITESTDQSSQKPIEDARMDIRESELMEDWLDTDDMSFLVQSPLTTPLEENVSISGHCLIQLASQERQQESIEQTVVELTDFDDYRRQERKRSLTGKQQFDSHKKVKSSQGQSPRQRDIIETPSEGTKQLPRPFAVSSDIFPIPTDSDEIDSVILKEFLDVVDFF